MMQWPTTSVISTLAPLINPRKDIAGDHQRQITGVLFHQPNYDVMASACQVAWKTTRQPRYCTSHVSGGSSEIEVSVTPDHLRRQARWHGWSKTFLRKHFRRRYRSLLSGCFYQRYSGFPEVEAISLANLFAVWDCGAPAASASTRRMPMNCLHLSEHAGPPAAASFLLNIDVGQPAGGSTAWCPLP